jgi:tripartite-type tricarboxylate transporter receptor subunit TctC
LRSQPGWSRAQHRFLPRPYPAKPVKIIVSTSPGGITDIAARILGAHMTDRTDQSVVIENGGASCATPGRG